MKSALFRVDGSHRLGLGHIMRCLALAQGLREVGVKPLFVTKDYEPSVIELICRSEDIELIPAESSFAEDASRTTEFAERYNVRLIVTDLSNTDSLVNLEQYHRYLQALKAADRFMIILDRLVETDFTRGLQIIPYYGAENMNLRPRGGMKLLMGPKYFIFRQEFVEAARAKRDIKKDARNILVTMGGSDPSNLTMRIIKILAGMNRDPLNLRIVIGILYSDQVRQELESILAGHSGDYKLIMGSDNMADLMLWSDLAITGGGLTKYETAVTGTPSIIISQTAREAEMSTEFEKGGSALHLACISQIGEADIARAIEKLLEDNVLRSEMTKRGQAMVDGKGIRRIIAEIPPEVLS